MPILPGLPSLTRVKEEVERQFLASAAFAVWGVGIALLAGCRDRTRLVAAAAATAGGAVLHNIPSRLILGSGLSARTKLIVDAILYATSMTVDILAFRYFDVIGKRGTVLLGVGNAVFLISQFVIISSSWGDEDWRAVDRRFG